MDQIGKHVLAIVTDAYGAFGGIAQVSRDVISVFARDPEVARVTVLPRVVPHPPGDVPAKVKFEAGASANALAYMVKLLWLCAAERVDVIYCAHIHLAPLAMLASKLTKAPWVLTLHGVEVWVPTGRKLTNFAAKRASLYLPVSGFTQERFRSWSGVPADLFEIMPNPVHLEAFAPGEKSVDLVGSFGIANKSVLMTLGRLNASEQSKGFDRMIELLPRLCERIPDLVYLIAGDGDDRARLEALAQACGVGDRVIFAGFVPEGRKADFYRLADVYVMPSVGEGFGLVFLEAMACGIPTIASSIDGGREAVRDGELGATADPFDPSALEAQIITALAKPRAVPQGLAFFNYDGFTARFRAAVHPLMGLARPQGGAAVRGSLANSASNH